MELISFNTCTSSDIRIIIYLINAVYSVQVGRCANDCTWWARLCASMCAHTVGVIAWRHGVCGCNDSGVCVCADVGRRSKTPCTCANNLQDSSDWRRQTDMHGGERGAASVCISLFSSTEVFAAIHVIWIHELKKARDR